MKNDYTIAMKFCPKCGFDRGKDVYCHICGTRTGRLEILVQTEDGKVNNTHSTYHPPGR